MAARFTNSLFHAQQIKSSFAERAQSRRPSPPDPFAVVVVERFGVVKLPPQKVKHRPKNPRNVLVLAWIDCGADPHWRRFDTLGLKNAPVKRVLRPHIEHRLLKIEKTRGKPNIVHN